MKHRFSIVLFCLLSSLYSGQGASLFHPIQSYLHRYRQSIEKNDLTVENGVIYLELNGRRTNHKSLLLLGFHSVGRQLQKSSFHFNQIQITIHYDMKETQQMSAVASMESVLDLSQGRMNPEQFFSKVRY